MHEPNSREPNLLLGFDYGTKQIGVAGQMITCQARELCNLKAQDGIRAGSRSRR